MPQADTPESVPQLFARAWNDRDADALAALFDKDADFVNVTGLWWHDREAIRKAHAYGLARIFDRSTLTVTGVRVRRLAEDIAVVHARLHLTGQTASSDEPRPQTRRTIMSLVLCRTAQGWRCVSAQNTDVVPGMETHVAGRDGVLRPASYRRGDGRAGR
ncbi:MAG TPA: SgcJ/EcaC family oxidoreductase [Paracoccus sp. (in: a-proteobacteria)]|nr:SgcJ/EcaC family oxidoreductase [Paracoccus sp. (in: a-proteobacteria)]